MKILAMYLPQFHEIKENNRWWGKGYTEWNAVQNAKKYFTKHNQPRVPMNNNYYDLSDPSGKILNWQASLAKKYGVYGFCIYHYWFKTGCQLLEKPMEILLHHPEIDIKYCVCWANETWRRTWYGVKNEILMQQEYGEEEEWTNHFLYLLKFFRDNRYIKINNKPIINIYHSYEIPRLEDMRILWDKLARKEGFDGIYLIVGNTGAAQRETRTSAIDAYYNYEPSNCRNHELSIPNRLLRKVKNGIKISRNKIMKKNNLIRLESAQEYYRYTTKLTELNGKKCYLGTFVSFDDTPRRQYKGLVIHATPNEFRNNLKMIKQRLNELNRDDDFVYVTAWNEWGEGAYLEPDTINQYNYLNAIKDVVENE